MAMLKCPACGEIISERLKGCAHCGYPFDNSLENDCCTETDNEEELSEEEEIKEQIRKFNWGAFLLTPFWGFSNGMPWLFLIYLINWMVAGLAIAIYDSLFLPALLTALVIPFILSIYFGVTGSRLSWSRNGWNDIFHFVSVQKTWAMWGFIILAVFVILLLINLILMYFCNYSCPIYSLFEYLNCYW